MKSPLRLLFMFIAFIILNAGAYAEQTFVIHPNRFNISEDQSFILTAHMGRDEIDAASVSWTSIDESIATVDNAGKVIGLSAGTTLVQGIYESDTSYSEVTVKENLRKDELRIVPQHVNIKEGANFQLYAVVNHKKIDVADLQWLVKDESIVTVTQTGAITGVLAGQTIVTAILNSDSAFCEVNVYETHVQDSICTRLLLLEIGEMKTILSKRDTLPDDISAEVVGDAVQVEIDKYFNITAVAVGEALVKIFKEGELKYEINILVVDQGTKRAVADSIRNANDGHIHIRFSKKVKKRGNGNIADSIRIDKINDNNEKSSYVDDLTVISANIDNDGRTLDIELSRKLTEGEIVVVSLEGGLSDEDNNDVIFQLSVQAGGEASSLLSVDNSVEVKMFPNPVTGMQFNVQASQEITQVLIYNMAGSLVQSNHINSFSGIVDIDAIQKGIYAVQIMTIENKISTHKLIVN